MAVTQMPRPRFASLKRFCAAAMATAAFAVPATAETLADALISAYRHSHLLDQNRAVLRAADEDVATAVAAPMAAPVTASVSRTDKRHSSTLPFG